jgi:hypothetical protein
MPLPQKDAVKSSRYDHSLCAPPSAVKLVEEAPVTDPYVAVFVELGGYEITPYFAEDVAVSRNADSSVSSSIVSRAATSRSLFSAWI